MAATHSFKQHHVGILASARKLAGLLDVAQLTRSAENVRGVLSELSGRLKVHLAMEDKALYPRLLTQGDAEAQRVTRRFMNEMGTLSKTFEAYVQRWPSPAAIQASPASFVAETKAIFAALQTRVGLEERDLYPLADRL
jgi:hypothetical protein